MILSIQFETFLRVAETLNFTKGGNQLGLTQSAVSQQIRYLEDHWGTPLFLRKGRGVELTEAGAFMYSKGKQIEQLSQRMTQKLGGYKQGRRSFRIGATLTVGEYIIPPVIAALKQKEAQYDLFLDIGNTAAIIDQLAKGVLDCAVVEGLFDKTAFKYITLQQDEMVFVYSPLEEMPETIGRGDLKKMILREEGSGTYEYFRDYLKKNSIILEEDSIMMRVGSLTAIKSMVISGMGYTIISREAVKEELSDGRLATRPLLWGPLIRDLTLVYTDSSPYFFVEELQTVAAGMNNSI
ncbi:MULTISPECIES: LysR family transcriptional regulator [unclassified Oceanispirochaeta]|uniref:LysR family transcriptional regulator n=1 Tax=unclassified Oceanispirochaeta TaxID=2635722 RepID=UPI000E097A03|nr:MULTISPECIES: LysR family transcriptional regulator [unclassified Oceanispirochaeta]MBF9015838.1 LysR family transcriptional regulator [Oceanispirochaeta sp. M2]NPD72301.1 LysR family transcriptional regulator [Oceanispirochaeta sp. M1]RDG32074.1 LysR family transcriptional regulator [Oceanispirochaeta sp. M1]